MKLSLLCVIGTNDIFLICDIYGSLCLFPMRGVIIQNLAYFNLCLNRAVDRISICTLCMPNTWCLILIRAGS